MSTQTAIGSFPEIEANSAIAQYLDECGKGWSANAERRQTLVDDNGRPGYCRSRSLVAGLLLWRPNMDTRR